jgi:tRNA/rRNA methyltransferase
MTNFPVIILVNPQMGENIGMCARAMLNCGLSELRLVAPRDGWPNEAARATSSGAIDVIETATAYATLADAVADRKFVMATTARERDMLKPVLTPETAAQAIIKAGESAIVFGPERAGLTNEDLTCCDAIINIPLNPDYMSLNLSQAVLLVSYEWYKLNSEGKKLSENQTVFMDQFAISDGSIAAKNELETFLGHLENGLDEAGFFKSEAQKPTMLNNLRNTFQRMRLTSQEVQTFHGMIKALRGKEWKR